MFFIIIIKRGTQIIYVPEMASILLKVNTYDPVNNYNYVEDIKVSVSIKKINANKYTLSEIFLSEILKRLSAFYFG